MQCCPMGVQKAIQVEETEVEGDGENRERPAATVEPSARAPAPPPPVSQADTKPPAWPMTVGVIVLLALAVIVGYRRVRYA